MVSFEECQSEHVPDMSNSSKESSRSMFISEHEIPSSVGTHGSDDAVNQDEEAAAIEIFIQRKHRLGARKDIINLGYDHVVQRCDSRSR